jgi:hypothetical protein
MLKRHSHMTYIHVYTITHTLSLTDTHTHSPTHQLTHPHTHTYSLTHTHTHTHSPTHTHILTHPHTHIHTHTHTCSPTHSPTEPCLVPQVSRDQTQHGAVHRQPKPQGGLGIYSSEPCRHPQGIRMVRECVCVCVCKYASVLVPAGDADGVCE